MSTVELPGLGIDVEDVARFARVDERLFTAAEVAHAAGRAESLAGIWCAKEAVVKAVSRWRLVHVRDVAVDYDGDRPYVRLPGFDVQVSISHTSQQAVAIAMALPNATGGAA